MIPQIHAAAVLLSGEVYFLEEDVSTWQSLQGYTVMEVHTAQKETYVAYALLKQGRDIYVVFRGTQGLKDMFTDIQYKPITVEDRMQVHSGIYKATEKSMSMMQNALLSEATQCPIANIIFTGHSLGGAAAMAARLLTLVKGWNLAAQYHVITFGAPLLFCGEASLMHPKVQQVFNESHCYVNDTDLFPRLLGPKLESWKGFFEKNDDLFKKYGTGMAVMSAAALTAATFATGGLATAVFLGAGAVMGAKAHRESAKNGMSVRDSGVLKMIIKGLSSKSLDDAVVQSYVEVGQYYYLDEAGTLEKLDGTKARQVLQIPTAPLMQSVVSHKICYYQQKLLLLSAMASCASEVVGNNCDEDY